MQAFSLVPVSLCWLPPPGPYKPEPCVSPELCFGWATPSTSRAEPWDLVHFQRTLVMPPRSPLLPPLDSSPTSVMDPSCRRQGFGFFTYFLKETGNRSNFIPVSQSLAQTSLYEAFDLFTNINYAHAHTHTEHSYFPAVDTDQVFTSAGDRAD